jgi:nicotinate-nucleotide pyrophosphorylase (carboxylating)
MIDPTIDALLNTAIAEDIGAADATTHTLIASDHEMGVRIILKEAGVVAGLPILKALFAKLSPKVEVSFVVPEGSFQQAGTIIAAIQGPATVILSGVQIAITLLSHASAVATTTWEYVKEIGGFRCQILDTRKTLPGLRAVEKYAVRIGGGFNHRFGLHDRIVIKTHHIKILKTQTEKPVHDAALKIEKAHPGQPYEIEIEDLKYLPEALQTHATAILLINMPPKEISKAVALIKKTNKKIYINNGGAITLDTVRAYAATGVDGICVDELTSTYGLQMSLRLS